MSGGGGRKYGVQVGNETYSLILTPEDWEKRRQDRENAKKLSLANNKRRKALDDRKRVAEARENRKRELELYKRRQRQIEATERYQRFHIGAKDKRSPSTEQSTAQPYLEDVLQKLRGGYGDGVSKQSSTVSPNSQSREQLSASTSDQSQNIASTSQSRHPGLERTQWQNMKEYAEDVRRQILSVQRLDYDLPSKHDNDQDENLPDDNDGQDSLHGSSVSTSSQPSYSSLSAAKQNSDDSAEGKGQKDSTQPPRTQWNAGIPTWRDAPGSNHGYMSYNHGAQNSKHHGNFSPSQTPISVGADSGVLCKRDNQTGRITYYVKAYRPWSANVSNKTFQSTFGQSANASVPLRPSSSFETSRKNNRPANETAPPKPRYHDTWTSSSDRPVENTSSNTQEITHKPAPTTEFDHPKSDAGQVSHIEITPPGHGYRVSSAPARSTTATKVTTFFEQSSAQSSTASTDPTYATSTVTFVPGTGYSGVGQTQLHLRPSASDNSRLSAFSRTINDSFLGESEKSGGKIGDKQVLKGILRRHSKYETAPPYYQSYSRQPSYQSAGLARQKWLNGITSDTDSSDREPRARSAEVKSVRWHEVQYNDGTSSTLDTREGVTPKPPPAVKPQPSPKPAPRGRAAKKPPQARPKSSPARAGKGGRGKGGRKLRPAKEPQINIVPHPPPAHHTPQLSMSTVVNYSINPSDSALPIKEFKSPRVNSGSLRHRASPNSSKRVALMSRNKLVFPRKGNAEGNGEAVTMSTLKSSGNESHQQQEDGIISRHGNQVTIKVSSTNPIISVPASAKRNTADSRIPLNGTPTDQEIEMLWDKVRAYLAWSRSKGSVSTASKKSRSTPERKVAWTTPTEPTKQLSANIISIDGGIFSKQPAPEESNSQNAFKTQQLPLQYERYGIGKSTIPQSEEIPPPARSASTCDTVKGLTGADLTNLPLDLSEISIQYTEDEFASSCDKNSLSDDTLNLISSIRKAMSSKSNPRVAGKNAQGMVQYQPRRGRARVDSNMSSSFILPYGFENQLQKAATQMVPSSSSFHGGPLESLQLMSENHQRAARQKSLSTNSQRLQRKFLDRQKIKMLKPLAAHKNQNNLPKFYEMSPSEFSAAILPDPGSTYRFAHDVSFDEGSRYRTTDLHNGFKGNPSDHGLNGLTRQFSSAVAMRNQDNGRSDLRISSRDHSSNGNNSNAKDAARSSASNDKCDLPPTLSPTSPTISPAVAASASNTAFIPPPSASRQNAPTCTAVPPSNITFRLHKEKRNWNDRLGDLSINGGGYSNSHSAGSNAKSDAEPMLRMNMTSAVQRSLQTRERALAVATKSRISSRYSNKNGSASSEPNYSDPCMAAPPSFQQRLMDLSMLESETVKYERNRKLRRKKNQDKDS